VANIELADIKTTLLQSGETYKEQIGGDIYSISEELRNVMYRDIEHQAHHTQVLLADELDHCKNKGDKRIKNHIKERCCLRQKGIFVQTICHII